MKKLTPEQLWELFINREDAYGLQMNTGAYFCQKKPIVLNDMREHLSGKKTIGAYALALDNKVKWACVDLDGKDMKELYIEARLIYNTFKGFPRMLEESGRRGYHIWIFFNPRVTAVYAQSLVKAYLNRIGLNKHEVFPKQVVLNAGRKYGNLVKIPCGKHQRSGNFSKILKMEDIKWIG